jgi:hypothetical protein
LPNFKRISFKKECYMAKKKAKRKYSPKASEEVGKELHRAKMGTAESGKSGKPVKSRKQAIAIGLSKARKKGAKVPRRTLREMKSVISPTRQRGTGHHCETCRTLAGTSGRD